MREAGACVHKARNCNYNGPAFFVHAAYHMRPYVRSNTIERPGFVQLGQLKAPRGPGPRRHEYFLQACIWRSPQVHMGQDRFLTDGPVVHRKARRAPARLVRHDRLHAQMHACNQPKRGRRGGKTDITNIIVISLALLCADFTFYVFEVFQWH